MNKNNAVISATPPVPSTWETAIWRVFGMSDDSIRQGLEKRQLDKADLARLEGKDVLGGFNPNANPNAQLVADRPAGWGEQVINALNMGVDLATAMGGVGPANPHFGGPGALPSRPASSRRKGGLTSAHGKRDIVRPAKEVGGTEKDGIGEFRTSFSKGGPTREYDLKPGPNETIADVRARLTKARDQAHLDRNDREATYLTYLLNRELGGGQQAEARTVEAQKRNTLSDGEIRDVSALETQQLGIGPKVLESALGGAWKAVSQGTSGQAKKEKSLVRIPRVAGLPTVEELLQPVHTDTAAAIAYFKNPTTANEARGSLYKIEEFRHNYTRQRLKHSPGTPAFEQLTKQINLANALRAEALRLIENKTKEKRTRNPGEMGTGRPMVDLSSFRPRNTAEAERDILKLKEIIKNTERSRKLALGGEREPYLRKRIESAKNLRDRLMLILSSDHPEMELERFVKSMGDKLKPRLVIKGFGGGDAENE